MKRTASIAAALAACAASPALAQSVSTVSVSTGIDFSSGDYGQATKTEILVVPVTASWRNDWLRLSGSLPYVRIDGAGVVLGPDGQPLPGVPGATGNRSGLGDLSFGGTVSLPSKNLGGLEVDLGGRVKLPTSKESEALGTGETDFSVAADVSYLIGAWSPFVTLGYRFLGDPAGVNFRNTFAASAGTSVSVGKTVLIASYDYSEASSPLAEDSQEVFGAVSAPLTNRLNWTAYGTAGLSEGSPDYGLGLLLTWKWN